MMENDRNETNVVLFQRGLHVLAEDDVIHLMAEHGRRGALCDQLEACADALPGRPSPDTAAQLCRALLEIAQAQNEGPGTMFRRRDADPLTAILLDHVRARRLSDASHAIDLIAALGHDPAETPTDDAPIAPDALGYMLRCYFDNCRRAMDFETLAVLTLSGRRLTCSARDMLVASLRERVGSKPLPPTC